MMYRNLFNAVFFCVFLSFKGPISAEITGPTHNKVVVCYIGTWAVYRPARGSFSIEHINPNVCTHLVYSFAGLNSTFDSIRSLDPWQDLADDYGKRGYERLVKLKDRYPHLKITIALGGWNEGSANYSQLASDAARRGRFVSNAVEFVRKYNFDGLDLDWEFPGKRGGSPNDKRNFLLLVKELRSAFNKFNLLLTAAFGAGKDTIDLAYDVEGLSIYLDFIHMMCYDYHGAWDHKTGANAPLKSSDFYNVEYTVNYMLQMGAKPEKLVIGLPLYGRTFNLVDNPAVSSSPNDHPQLGSIAQDSGFQGPYTRENGFMGYNEICVELKNKSSGYETHWDDNTKTPYAVNGNKFISYDDERSIKEKVKFVIKKGLAGAMVWSLDTDDFQGDCADESNPQGHVNFPLMHSINEAISEAINEIDFDKENEIPHGKEESKSGGAVKNFSFTALLIVMYITYFM